MTGSDETDLSRILSAGRTETARPAHHGTLHRQVEPVGDPAAARRAATLQRHQTCAEDDLPASAEHDTDGNGARRYRRENSPADHAARCRIPAERTRPLTGATIPDP